MQFIDLLWHARIKPTLYLLAFFGFIAFSITMVLGELSLVDPGIHYYFSPLGKLVEGIRQDYIVTLVL